MGFFSKLFSGAPVIARFTFDLYGPRAWHPRADVLGPIPSSLYPDGHIYQIGDYYIEEVLGPVAVRPRLELLVSDPNVVRSQVLIQGWLDFLENQVGKLPKRLQYFTLARIDEQREAYYEDGTNPSVVSPADASIHLGQVVADLHAGRWIYSTVATHPKNMKDVEVVSLVLIRSLAVITGELDPTELRAFMFFLSYGMWKWQTEMPRPISTRSTWDFSNIQGMVEEAKRLGLLPA